MCARLYQLDDFSYNGQKSNSECSLIKGNQLTHTRGFGWPHVGKMRRSNHFHLTLLFSVVTTLSPYVVEGACHQCGPPSSQHPFPGFP